ncbi:MAG: ATP-dependent DNA helicase RecG [Deltaproteobacteria bacterium]|nr:ATP-dependent DNA helicase RecG [Deltaproteobacteria bacterium]TLN01202.1 MAG: ATP-dependent DNA helicase RecG [bacterium]
MPVVKIADNGKLTLPEDILEGLGLASGDSVLIEMDGQRAVLSRPPAASGPGVTERLRDAIRRKNLETPMRFIKGVGPKMAELLARKGIHTVEDALYLLPNRYEDRRKLRRIAELRPGCVEVFSAEVKTADSVASKGGRRFFEALVSDDSGSLVLKWFQCNPRYMQGIWQPGKRGIFTGEVVVYGSRREIHHPEVEWLKAGDDVAALVAGDPVNFGRTVPFYPLTEGLHQKSLRKVLKEVVDTYSSSLTIQVPAAIVRRRSLLPVSAALQEVHFPGDAADLAELNNHASQAHRTLVFDELFFLQLGLAMKKQGTSFEEGISFTITHQHTRPLLKLLPYALTAAQKRVLSEIKEDMASPGPMYRLVQGDVGSGKTIVALLSALLAVENDCQTAIMAPTELLAEQHYLNIHKLCEQLGITVCLLSSAIRGKARAATLAAIEAGEVQIIVGTQAVIQEKVEFKRLGLGIIDEQHRFGVLQRGVLKKKGVNPHILVMTATPIPRSLAMTVFGDLSLSVIDELPPGRTPVTTKVCFESQRAQVYRLISEEVRAGRQAYLICPLVEESEKSELKAATQVAEHLAVDIFPELRIGLLHGRLKPEEKEAIMHSFKAREIDILVATTVIEVGIDVPNATVMIVEHAERFGLSQLHQLRGRVGRGSQLSRCILLAGGKLSEEAQRRLKVMEGTTDGFRIAEADLELRGPGDFLGTRQAGLPDFRVSSILRDARILEEARQEAFALVEQDPRLSSEENFLLREELLRRWGGRLELAGVA